MRIGRCVASLTILLGMSACGHSSARISDDADDELEFGGSLAGRSVSQDEWRNALEDGRQGTLFVENVGCGFRASGSGIAVGQNTVVTNRHVVKGARTLSVRKTSRAKLSSA